MVNLFENSPKNSSDDLSSSSDDNFDKDENGDIGMDFLNR